MVALCYSKGMEITDRFLLHFTSQLLLVRQFSLVHPLCLELKRSTKALIGSRVDLHHGTCRISFL